MSFPKRFGNFFRKWIPLTGCGELQRLRSKVAALEAENNRWKTTCREMRDELNNTITENRKLTARLARQKQKLAEILSDYQAGLNALKAELETTEADSCKREVTRQQAQTQHQKRQPPNSQKTPHKEKPAATHREKETWPLKKPQTGKKT